MASCFKKKALTIRCLHKQSNWMAEVPKSQCASFSGQAVHEWLLHDMESICYEKYRTLWELTYVMKSTQHSGNSVANSAVTIAVTGPSHPRLQPACQISILKLYKKTFAKIEVKLGPHRLNIYIIHGPLLGPARFHGRGSSGESQPFINTPDTLQKTG